MTSDDAVATSEIHLRTLPHGFFARLGPRFLAAYHASFVGSPHAVATVATLDGRVAGFLVGTLRTRAHYRHVLRRHGVGLAVRLLWGSLRRPSVLLELLGSRLSRYLRTLARFTGPGGDEEESRSRRRGPVAVLTHVAVLPAARGHGLGAGLVGAFTDAAREAGIGEVRLVTRAAEDGASAFYDRLGWEELGERWSADGQRVIEFRCST